MKKIALLACALISTTSALAYSGSYYSSSSDEMSGFAIFTLIVMIVYIILSIIILVRWWKMTSNVTEIRQHLIPHSTKLTYLVAIGEKDQAQKKALAMLVDLLYPIYQNPFDEYKARSMNTIIEDRLPLMLKLGLSVPDYVTSGEKFIDYINGLTGNNVPYKMAKMADYRNN